MTLLQTTRQASTITPLVSGARTTLYTLTTATLIALTYLYATDNRSSIHTHLIPPLIRHLVPDPEDGHRISVRILSLLHHLGLHPRERAPATTPPSETETPDLHTQLWDTVLDNPISISAGLDKDAEIPDALFALGAGIVEVGGCTPLPQAGNAKPRVFRLPSQNGLINRYGLNSSGAEAMARRLRERVRLFARAQGLGVGVAAEQAVLDGEAGVPPGSLTPGRLLMVQVAKNKETDGTDIEAVTRDYAFCVEKLARYADVLVVNVSSPNTPGLRTLQNVEPLSRILSGVVGAAQECQRRVKPRVLVKVSPDEDADEQIEGIVQAVWRSGVDGVVVGNTTSRRTGLEDAARPWSIQDQKTLSEPGGYSGPQMYGRTLGLVKRYRRLLDQGVPDGAERAAKKIIVATGGITNGHQVEEVLEAGASVAQIYTALVYGGSGTITRMKKELRRDIVEHKAKWIDMQGIWHYL